MVRIEDGKARIQEMVSITDWLTRHKDVLIRHLRAMNLMWDQRHGEQPEALCSGRRVDQFLLHVGDIEAHAFHRAFDIAPLQRRIDGPQPCCASLIRAGVSERVWDVPLRLLPDLVDDPYMAMSSALWCPRTRS